MLESLVSVVLLIQCGLGQKKENYSSSTHSQGMQLPVRSVFRAPEKFPIFRALVVHGQSEDERTVWCGGSLILLIDINNTGLGFCRKCHCRPRNDITTGDHVIDLTLMEQPGEEREMEKGRVDTNTTS